MIRQVPGVLLAAGLLLGLAVPPGMADETLTFDEEMAAVIWARQLNDTQAQWMAEEEQEKPLFFDAAHRFLLLRFPGSAEAIAAKLAAGHEIAAARLVLTWQDQEWLKTAFIETVQKRGAAIIKARGLSSAASAANAIVKTVGLIRTPTAEGEHFSLAVSSDGSYGIEEGLIFSYPVRSNGEDWEIVQGIQHNSFAMEKIEKTHKELISEREAVQELL